jgi:Tol biopolymer transport system component
VVNTDGSGTVRLTWDGSSYTPAWSPGGVTIAFTGPDGIYLMNHNGTGRTRLTAGAEPAWSADGTRIAYTLGHDLGGSALHVMLSDGSGITAVTSAQSSVWDTHASWSPDGGRIVFQRSWDDGVDRYTDVFVAASDGSWAVPLIASTDPWYYKGTPAWSR